VRRLLLAERLGTGLQSGNITDHATDKGILRPKGGPSKGRPWLQTSALRTGSASRPGGLRDGHAHVAAAGPYARPPQPGATSRRWVEDHRGLLIEQRGEPYCAPGTAPGGGDSVNLDVRLGQVYGELEHTQGIIGTGPQGGRGGRPTPRGQKR